MEVAEEVIAYAEDAAERVEEEEKVAKAAEAEARAAGTLPAPEPAAPAAPRPGGVPRPEDLFPREEAQPAEEVRPTVESVFGTEATTKPAEEQPISAAQVFGEPGPDVTVSEKEPQPQE